LVLISARIRAALGGLLCLLGALEGQKNGGERGNLLTINFGHKEDPREGTGGGPGGKEERGGRRCRDFALQKEAIKSARGVLVGKNHSLFRMKCGQDIQIRTERDLGNSFYYAVGTI